MSSKLAWKVGISGIRLEHLVRLIFVIFKRLARGRCYRQRIADGIDGSVSSGAFRIGALGFCSPCRSGWRHQKVFRTLFSSGNPAASTKLHVSGWAGLEPRPDHLRWMLADQPALTRMNKRNKASRYETGLIKS